MTTDPTTAEEFFAGAPGGLGLLRAVAERISAFGGVEMRVSKSQLGFRRHHGFASVWRPDRHLRSDKPAVVSIASHSR